MDEFHILTKRKIRRRFKKELKSTSIATLSKSIAHEISNDLANESLLDRSFSTNSFVPFRHERDGLGRIIKGNPPSSTKTLLNKSSKPQIKIKSRTRKVPLTHPCPDLRPAVGTYSINTNWIKQSFHNPSFSNKSPIKAVDFQVYTEPTEIEVAETSIHKPKRFQSIPIKNRVKVAPRKKGIWEDIDIHKIPTEMQIKSITETKKIMDKYDSSIRSCIRKMKGELNSLQKYLKV